MLLSPAESSSKVSTLLVSTNFMVRISMSFFCLAAHDFFAPQPVHAPSMFFLRRVLHDWSDDDCVRILRQLRDAAGPNTQLMILDTIMSYVCEEPLSDVPGAEVSPPPAPLLSNGGYAYSSDYMVDLAVRISIIV